MNTHTSAKDDVSGARQNWETIHDFQDYDRRSCPRSRLRLRRGPRHGTSKVVAPANGWLVVHRTGADMKPGPVVGHAPLRKGENMDVAAILTEEVGEGDMLMLMVHGEDGGMTTGIFEYTLGAKEDGPIRMDGNLVMTTITAQ